MTRPAKALMRVLAVCAALSHPIGTHAASREEWSGTYRCGPRLDGSGRGAGYAAQVTLVLNDGVATINRQSVAVSQTLTGKVGADGRVTLEGDSAMRRGKSRWRYYFNGRFEGDKFEARGATLPTSGDSKLRECTMTLARVSPRVRQAPAADKEPLASAPIAAAPGPAPVAAVPDTAQQPTAAEPPAVTAAPIATENKTESRRVKYSRADRILLALFLGIGVAGAGALLYDWRRPAWLTPPKAVAAIVAAGVGTAGLAWYAFSHLNL